MYEPLCLPHAEVIVEVTDHTGRRDAHIVYARQAATGNNPEFSNEMARRLLRIRLDAHLERPRQRAEFRHPDLNTWVRANRARLTTRSSFERSEDIQSVSFCWVRATNRRETADFESPEPFAEGTVASGRRTARPNLRVATFISVRFIAHCFRNPAFRAAPQLGSGISLPLRSRTRGRSTSIVSP